MWEIEGYTILDEIGKGGMGCVYKGTSPNGESVAIKMMDNQYCCDPEIRRMFYNEVESLKKLYHPSVVKIRGNAFQDFHGNLYMPMEYVEGETIQQRVKRSGPFDEKTARSMMSKILKAFAYIHHENRVHRDIKPSNIMIRPNGEICIIDFGIVKDMTFSTGKTVGMVVGTDGYMSPEQVAGLNIDHRTDIYSLGCLLHYMLTGTHAVVKKSNDMDTKLSILNDTFPSAKQMRPELSDDIQSIIYKAVDKNMTKRFQTANEFYSAITGDFFDDGGTKFDGTIITVGRKNSDIVIDNPYVSSHHLTIRYKNLSNSPNIVIEDDSTNGTGVDGKYLRKGSVSFPFDLRMVVVSKDYGGQESEILYLDKTIHLPEVYLAGRPEIRLDWNEVFAKLYERIPEEFGDQLSPSRISEPHNLPVGLGVLSFLFPIVGWILSSTMRKSSLKAAKTAGILGWIGFGVYFSVCIIFMVMGMFILQL